MAPKKRNFGNIRTLPSGRFQARYTAPDGSVIKAPTTFASRRQADQWLSSEYTDLTRGVWRDPHAGNVSLSEYAATWLNERTWLKPKTRQLYADQLTRFIWPAPPAKSIDRIGPARRLGDRPLRQITRSMVDQWHEWVLLQSREGAAKRIPTEAAGSPRWNAALRRWAAGRGLDVAPSGRIPTQVRQAWEDAGRPALLPVHVLSPNAGHVQASQTYRLLHAILETAKSDGLIIENPCRKRGAAVTKSAERKPATLSELNAIVEATPERYRATILLAAWGGLRAGEIFALTRRNVDISTGCVSIDQGVVHIPTEGFVYDSPKTPAGVRTVHLPDGVMAALSDHLDRYTAEAPDALVFTTGNGTTLHSSNRTMMFRRAAAAAGRDDLRFHDLRHTGATLASESGASLATVMRRIGHSSIAAAMRYQHATDHADRRVAQQMTELTG